MEKGEQKNIEEIFCLTGEESFRKNLISRINRIAGQLRGIEKMILNHVKCDEILNQISSIKSALNGIAKVVLEAHLKNCIVQKVRNGVVEEATSELITILSKLMEKNSKSITDSNDNIVRKIEKQIAEMKVSIEVNQCCGSILKDIALIKNELDSMAKVILDRHVKNCLVRDIKAGNEEKIIDDFIYTINKMIK